MKKIELITKSPYAILIAVWLMLIANVCYAQRDTLVYIQGLPQTGEDTLAQQTRPADLSSLANYRQIRKAELPEAIQKTLRAEDKLYKGWKRGSLLLDENTGLYWIQISENNIIRSYAFSAAGEAVNIDEQIKPAE